MSISFRAVVDVGPAAYRRTYSPSRLAWRSLASCCCPTDELGELSQWLCHDDSTINIVRVLLLLLLIIIINQQFLTCRNMEPYHPLQGRELSMCRELQWCFDVNCQLHLNKYYYYYYCYYYYSRCVVQLKQCQIFTHHMNTHTFQQCHIFRHRVEYTLPTSSRPSLIYRPGKSWKMTVVMEKS